MASSKPKKKYYVVWIGRTPGIYETWPEAQEQISEFPGARHKSFTDRAAAEEAFEKGQYDHLPLSNRKFYVVWRGHSPGIYGTWEEASEQISDYPGARYKSYPDIDSATAAYRKGEDSDLDMMKSILRHNPAFGRKDPTLPKVDYTQIPEIRLDAIAVDGACSGNPGKIEYRAVRVVDGAEIFRVGDKTPLVGTNNIAEYLGMIHLAATLQQRGDSTTPIYTDSKNTLAWLRRGASKTTLQRTPRTAATLDLLARADRWLALNGPIKNPILKWRTEEWGEIPADFGRK
ncbi:MAG: ribonuclease H family protein [Muribaculaceae bacterium]|nr:ribonuclease H family protein [Muribaculaceae bacterium]